MTATLISSTDVITSGTKAQIGPFVDGNNNVYAVYQDTTNTLIRVVKASDPNSSWSGQDGTVTASPDNLAVVQNGTVLEIFWLDRTDEQLQTVRFNTSDVKY